MGRPLREVKTKPCSCHLSPASMQDCGKAACASTPSQTASILLKDSQKEWHVFRPRKTPCKKPGFTTQSTTTSPRFTTTKHTKIRKTPYKNHLKTPPNFFPRPNAK